MLTCPYCQTENTNQVTQCLTCGSSLGSDMLPIGTLLFGNTLEVHGVLGRGGFGIVYEGWHFEHQKHLAIKELFPEGLATRGYNKQVIPINQSEMLAAIARTNREAQMLQKLKHPSATKLFAYWEENNTAYLAMELLQGETLERRIQNGQLLSENQAKQALLTILEVLEELHSHGFLHRDIKPSNIMYAPTRIELIDFGSLTEFKTGQRTKVSSRIATPEYAPLEQFGSEVTLSPATDLYALAATFCEAMTGSRVPSALDRANGASIEPSMLAVQKVSRELGDVLEKALELRMDLRFSNARIVLNLLLDFRLTPITQLVVVPLSPIKSSRIQEFFGWLIFGGVVYLIAVVWIIISSLNSNRQTAQTINSPIAAISIALPLFSSIRQYHDSKTLFFENSQQLKYTGYENKLILKYPKKVGNLDVSIDDFWFSNDLRYLIVKESFCSKNSCESYFRFEDIQKKITLSIEKWINPKGDSIENTRDNKVYFRYANETFYLVSVQGVFQSYNINGKLLFNLDLKHSISRISISDDNRYIFIKRNPQDVNYPKSGYALGLWVFQVNSFVLVNQIQFDTANDFFVVSALENELGIIVRHGRSFSYANFDLLKKMNPSFQDIDFLSGTEFTDVLRQSNRILISMDNKNVFGLEATNKTLKKIWNINLSDTQFVIESIDLKNLALFITKNNQVELETVDFYQGWRTKKPFREFIPHKKQAIRQLGVMSFHHSDNEYNYIQVVKSNLMQ